VRTFMRRTGSKVTKSGKAAQQGTSVSAGTAIGEPAAKKTKI